jgi:hypothetical protein
MHGLFMAVYNLKASSAEALADAGVNSAASVSLYSPPGRNLYPLTEQQATPACLYTAMPFGPGWHRDTARATHNTFWGHSYN